MDSGLLRKLNAERRARRAVICLTDLQDGRNRMIGEGDPVAGALGEAVATAFRSGRSASVGIGGRQFFLNVHLPSARIVVVGAGRISRALAVMARAAGFELSIIDPRDGFAAEADFPGWPREVLAAHPLDAYTALAALSHEPSVDDYPLQAALAAGCFYVGALGSRRTHVRRVERLLAAGVEAAAVARISAPIGLDIGAANPGEIAVAILADIVRALRRRGLPAGKEA